MPDSSAPVGIVDAAYFLPGDAVDLRDWGPRAGVAPDRIARLEANGCRYFHIGYDQSDADLAAAAVRRLAARPNVDLGRCDAVLHAHTQNFSVPAAPDSLLADVCARFGLRPKLAFSVEHLACAGIVEALALALRLLRNNPGWREILVLSSDRVFGGAEHRLRQDAGLQSDGGSAILVGRGALRAVLAAATVRRHGQLFDGPATPDMSRRIGMSAWSHTRRMVADDMQQSGMRASDYAAFMPNNADGPYWDKIAQGLGFTPSQIWLDNMGRRGHSCCSDLAVNLVDAGFDCLRGGKPVLAMSQSNVGAYGLVTLEAPHD